MKRIFYILVIVCAFIPLLNAQTMVTTNVQYRNVVLEEFTGINCGYCPDGHAIAESVFTDNPGRVNIINVHTGSYSVPSGGQPDFRTSFGSSLASNAGVTGFPAGTINRHQFSGASGLAISRSAWEMGSDSIFPQISPVNVGMTSTFDTATRELTVEVELYYTDNSPSGTNYINVAFLQNHVYAYQNGGGSNYDHKHILRYLITGQWGDTVTSTTQGSLVSRTYNYTVPDEYNGIVCEISNCEVTVFVSETQTGEIFTGVTAGADGGSNNGGAALCLGEITTVSEAFLESTAADTNTFTLNATSFLEGTEEMKFFLSGNAPPDWDAYFEINSTVYTDTAILNLTKSVPETVSVIVIPGNTPELCSYSLSMQSTNYPQAPVVIKEISVISGITDLVVTGSGSSGNGIAYNWESEYTDGLDYAGNQTYASTTAGIMQQGISAGEFSGVNNVFLNIGWSFPTLTDAEANALMSFLDNGGNLFISGQDIGWDIMSGSQYANGTATTQHFFTNYLHAGYVDDGSSSNSTLSIFPGDTVFPLSSGSSITDVYGGMYPDQISASGGAIPVFYYNTDTTKIAGIRYSNGTYKIVYIGVGVEMLLNNSIKNAIIKDAHNWFYNLPADIQPKAKAIPAEQVSVYPNPFQNQFTIEACSTSGGIIEIMDICGNIIKKVEIAPGSEIHEKISLDSREQGIYVVKVSSGKSVRYLKVAKD